MTNLADYNDFFLFLAGVLILTSVVYFLFRRLPQNIFISEKEMSKLRTSRSSKISSYKISFSKTWIARILFAIIILGFLLNQFLIWKMDPSGILNKILNFSITITKK